jgi:hypothetical protein
MRRTLVALAALAASLIACGGGPPRCTDSGQAVAALQSMAPGSGARPTSAPDPGGGAPEPRCIRRESASAGDASSGSGATATL